MPPATDKPTMVPVPTGVLSPPPVLEGAADDEEEVVVLESLEVTKTKEVDCESVVDDEVVLGVRVLEGGRLGPVMEGRPWDVCMGRVTDAGVDGADGVTGFEAVG